MTGRQFVNVAVNRQGVGDVTEGEISVQGFDADLAAKFWMLAQRFQLRAEDQRAARGDSVVQRLLACAITGDKKLLTAPVPNCEGEHAPQARYASGAILLVSVQNRLRVRMCFEPVAA